MQQSFVPRKLSTFLLQFHSGNEQCSFPHRKAATHRQSSSQLTSFAGIGSNATHAALPAYSCKAPSIQIIQHFLYCLFLLASPPLMNLSTFDGLLEHPDCKSWLLSRRGSVFQQSQHCLAPRKWPRTPLSVLRIFGEQNEGDRLRLGASSSELFGRNPFGAVALSADR